MKGRFKQCIALMLAIIMGLYSNVVFAGYQLDEGYFDNPHELDAYEPEWDEPTFSYPDDGELNYTGVYDFIEMHVDTAITDFSAAQNIVTFGANTGVTPMVAAGLEHTVALREDGTVWAWGVNHRGQLGDGTTTNRNTPIQVQDLSNVVSISIGSDHNVALKGDGTVWACA